MIDLSAIRHNGEHPKIFMAAGEVSGDRQGGYLARALLAKDPHIMLFGSGGDRMRDAGVDIRIQTSHLGCVGFQESARYVKPLRSALAALRRLIRLEHPDLAVLIDNEGFNGLLSKFLFNQGIPFVYYFAPQVWLWGEWRARAIAKKARAIIPAFAAEAEIYRREGGRVEWLGHPLLDIVRPEDDYVTTFEKLELDPSLPTMALMPGSRVQELEQLAPCMLSAARFIKARHPNLQIVLPLAAAHLLPLLQTAIDSSGMRQHVTIITDHVYTCLSRCEVVLASAGTATLEAALLDIPMVVAYRFTRLTFFFVRRLVKTRFIAMPNILLGEKIVPELVQDEITAERLASEALEILENRHHAQTIRLNLQRVPPTLGTSGVIDRAAALILRETSDHERTLYAEAP